MATGMLIARVDPELCIGNAMCRATAPRVFVADENGQSVVADSSADTPERILQAAEDCPVEAITVAHVLHGSPVVELGSPNTS